MGSLLLLALCCLPAQAQVKGEQHSFSPEKLNTYLTRMGADFKRAPDMEGAYIIIKDSVQHADRIVTLIVSDATNDQLEILSYPEVEGGFLNVSKLSNAESQRIFYEKLARVNYKSFGMFFVDGDGDIGVRFTFSTEDGIGYESFRAVVENCQRVMDRFTPVIVGFMTVEEGY
jgi:hypothetical protein